MKMIVGMLVLLSVARTAQAQVPKQPAADVHFFKIQGQIVDWDITLQAPAASPLLEFVDAGSPSRAIALALTKSAFTSDGGRTSLRGRTEIGEQFAEGYYVTTLKHQAGSARLGVLVVKHRRQFISFIPDNPKSAAFPPEIRAWTDEVKRAQRDAGARLMRDIENAIKEKKKEFVFPKGDYRLSLKGKARSGKSRYFEWGSVENFTLDGQGSTLWFDTVEANAFQLARCRNITFKNLIFDYDPLPFAQGKIVALDEKTRRLRFALDEGFEESLKPLSANKNLLRIHVFYDDSTRGRVIRNDWTAGFVSGRPIKPLGNGLYECGTVLRHKTPQATGIAVGDAIALCPRWGGSIFAMSYCDNVRFENVTIYAAASDATADRFSAAAGGRGTVHESVKIMRRPNTRRLPVTNSAGLYVQTAGKGFAVINSVFEGTMDDSVAVQTHDPLVVKQVAPAEIIVAQRSASLPILLAAGHAVAFYDLTTLAPRGGTRIQRIEPYTEQGLAQKEAARRRFAWGPTKFYKATLATPLQLQPMDLIMHGDCPAAADFRIENCFFYAGWARSLLVTGERGVIRNNTFEAGGRLNLGPSTSWLIGTFAKDILIENNRLIGICNNPIAPGDAVPIRVSGPKTHPLNTKITIRNNTIERCAYSGIVVQGVDGLTLTGNLLKQTNLKRHEPAEDGLDLNRPIVTRACRNVVENNNVVRP